MSLQDDSIQEFRRRGRPRKKQPATQMTSEAVAQLPAEPVPASQQPNDEQLAYTIAEEDISTFSGLLRSILQRDRAEIARVAKELDVTENTIYRWMNGNSDPRP